MKGPFKNLFVVIMILVFLIGSGTQVAPAEALAYPETTISLDLPIGWDEGQLIDIWGYDANTIYMAGRGMDAGSTLPLLYAKNGSVWSPMTPPLPVETPAWTAGSLRAVWGAGPNDLFAVGSGTKGSSTLPLIYDSADGTNWDPSSPALPGGWISGILEDVWGSGADNVFAVGYGNTSLAPTNPLVYRSTDGGGTWNLSLPTLPEAGWNGYLYGVWGSAANDIYVVGYGNAGIDDVPLIYHTSNNGDTWDRTILSLPTGWLNGSLFAVWGSAANNIYAIGSGNNGTSTVPLIYHYNGTSWAISSIQIPSGWSTATLTGIWGSGGTVYVTGYGEVGADTIPIMYRKTSSGWGAIVPDMGGSNSRYLEGIWGPDAYTAYAVGYSKALADGPNSPLLYSVGQDTTAPGAVTAFTASSGRFNGTVRLRWTAPADDAGNSNSGPVDSYTVIRSTANNLTSCSDADGTPITSGLPAPTVPGNTQYMFLSGLNPGTTYYFAVCAWDEADPTASSSPHVVASAVANVGDLPPEATTLVAPSGPITTNQPTYTWDADYYSSWYYLWVSGPSGNVIKIWYSAADAGCSSGIGTCSVTPSTPLASGVHTWWVRSWNPIGLSPWSAGMGFTAPVPVAPGQATLVSPSGSITGYNPTYTWNKVTKSTWYYLSVSGPGGYTFTKWYDSAAICGGTTCSVAGATPNLAIGTFTWKVQTWNNVGYGPWSTTLNFTTPTPVVPGAATLISPNGSIAGNNPTYTWNKVSASTWYYLSVSGPSGYAFTKWYESTAVCGISTCSIANATPNLAVGAYTWKVQTWSSAGYGPWSADMGFSTPVPVVPGATTLVWPTGSIDTGNPTYSWNKVTASTWYYLSVSGPSGYTFTKWYDSVAVCGISTCSIASATPSLVNGDYTWKVQTWSSAGYGPWSADMSFTVTLPTPPGAATLVSPNTTIPNHTPTYTWNDVSTSTWYYLWVNGPSGAVVKQWYSSSEAHCDGSTCWVQPTTTLASGAHTWWIQTWNAAGLGPWSTDMNFTVYP